MYPPTRIIQLVRSQSIDWQALQELGVTGLWVKTLRFDEQTGRPMTFLLKFEAGAQYPLHSHPAGEEVYVLEGHVRFGSHDLHPGDFLYTPPNGVHDVASDSGCTLLLQVPEEVVILA